MAFEFNCAKCGQRHVGMPSFGSPRPLSYYAVPESERERRCQLSEDDCVIDESVFLIRGCLEIPVFGQEEPFIWGVWVSLSRESFLQLGEAFGQTQRAHVGPFFGWLDAWLKPYPDTKNLKTMVHLRDNDLRPFIELEPTDHPLAVEQRAGISPQCVADIYALMVHAERE